MLTGRDEAIGAVCDHEQGTEDFEVLRNRLFAFLQKPSSWQYVVHGPTVEYRMRVWMELLEQGSLKLAERFALCGRGDVLLRKGDSFAIQPMRCGSRLCPRCARWRGGKFVRKVFAHLRKGPHGALWHVVLTQRVEAGERLSETRERLRSKWRRLGKKADLGVTAGLLTEHVKWSSTGGWHCHYHVIAECESPEALLSSWRKVSWAGDANDAVQTFCRKLVDAGEQAIDADPQQGELWVESKDKVVMALQYAVRDVAEGPSTFVLEGLGSSEFREFVTTMTSAKLHRCFGSWRGAPEEGASDETGVVEPGSVAQKECSYLIGTVDAVLHTDVGVQRLDALQWLYASGGLNQTDFAKRLRNVVKAACGRKVVAA